MEDSITPEELVRIINNIDKKYSYASKEYLLIIKDEPQRPCSLYISDCEQSVWFKILDVSFFTTMKKSLQLASSLKTFAGHLTSSLQKASSLQKEKTAIKISIQLQIGEGLAMACSFKVENRAHYNNPQQFKKSLRKFMLFLWDVKCSQLSRYKQEQTEQKEEMQKKTKEAEQEERRLKIGAAKKAAIGKNYVAKKGDLMNPQRKKRKKLGAKLGTGYESDMAVVVSSNQRNVQNH